MYLLSTDRAELKLFNTPEDVPAPGYAILSHVWGENEQTFQETQRLHAKCAETGSNPRDLATPKIREFCIPAEKDGYQWGWADTCCIDKSSSTELSEAINSMHGYYARAAVCYAHLSDVARLNRQPSTLIDDDDHVARMDPPGAHWHLIGTKAKLAQILEFITGIPVDVLTMKRELTDISIAGRMSWASDRQTTRTEDQAYCLMGIFGINMPTLYGEGRAAFMRLQEEIMRQSADTSLFAWGRGFDPVGEFDPGFVTSNFPTCQHRDACHEASSNLLAPDPSVFKDWSDVRYAPSQYLERIPPGLPTFTSTAHGILSYVPVIKYGDRVVGAVLLCVTLDNFRSGHHIALILTECPDARSPLGPLYDVGGISLDSQVSRLSSIYLPERRVRNEFEFTIEWRQIYIAHRPPSRTFNPQMRLLNNALFPSLHIPSSFNISHLDVGSTLSLSLVPGNLMLVLLLEQLDRKTTYFVVRFGLCEIEISRGSTVPWARLSFHASQPLPSQWTPGDDCSQDHISQWAQTTLDGYSIPHTRVFCFTLPRSSFDPSAVHHLTVGFSPYPHDPDLLVLDGLLLSKQHPYSRPDATTDLILDGDTFMRNVHNRLAPLGPAVVDPPRHPSRRSIFRTSVEEMVHTASRALRQFTVTKRRPRAREDASQDFNTISSTSLPESFL